MCYWNCGDNGSHNIRKTFQISLIDWTELTRRSHSVSRSCLAKLLYFLPRISFYRDTAGKAGRKRNLGDLKAVVFKGHEYKVVS